MYNPYQTQPAKIIKIENQTPGIKLFEFKTQKTIKHEPGQFIELSLPGFGEAPFAPCNEPGKNLELCIRAAGRLTNKLHELKKDDKVGIRGPFGKGWPTDKQLSQWNNGSKKKNLLIVVGGLGLVPLRSLILAKEKFFKKETIIQIFYGARTPDDFLFKNEFFQWRKQGVDLQLTIDKECSGWNQCVGVVTVLFDKKNVVPDSRAFLCGPPIMYRFVLRKLKEHGFADKNIYLSLERRMHCGLGVCQHCGIGQYYTCKDGPVFQYSEIKDIQGAI